MTAVQTGLDTIQPRSQPRVAFCWRTSGRWSALMSGTMSGTSGSRRRPADSLTTG